MIARNGAALARAAAVLVQDHMAVRSGESVLITADTASDLSAAEAVLNAAALAGAKPMLSVIPQLPFQGKLADPYLPSAISAAMSDCDVWIDLTHPFLAGSDAHDRALKTKRVRCLGSGGMDAAALTRLYGGIDLDRLYEVQSRLDDLIADAAGETCRVTDELGTDVTFTLAPATQKKVRRAEAPGMNTVPGSAVLLPELDTVRGTIRVVAVMHEHYAPLERPLTLEVDGRIRRVVERGPDVRVLERALRRAGGGEFGHVIHLSYGLHPVARFRGTCFIEDIRCVGANAIGLGEPWWVPGGGENHPDAVLMRQSLEIAGRKIVENGSIVAPADLATRAAELQPLYR
jgi:leucyl aminopeptidase (aminopeptidase T)